MTRTRALKLSMLGLLACIGGAILMASCLYLYLSPKLPSADELKDVQMQIPLRVTSKELKVIREFGEKKRTPVAFDDLPKHMINALLAAEDATFFEHKGIVISGLIRSAVQLVTEGRAVSGGSTITMQVARDFFFHKRKEFTRKFNEILLALRIENELTKDSFRILGTLSCLAEIFKKGHREKILPHAMTVLGPCLILHSQPNQTKTRKLLTKLSYLPPPPIEPN